MKFVDSLSLSPSVPIVHCFWQVLDIASSVHKDKKNAFADWPTLVCPCVGVHKRTSFLSSSLLFQVVLFVFLGWFVGWEVSGRAVVFLYSADFRIC